MREHTMITVSQEPKKEVRPKLMRLSQNVKLDLQYHCQQGIVQVNLSAANVNIVVDIKSGKK